MFDGEKPVKFLRGSRGSMSSHTAHALGQVIDWINLKSGNLGEEEKNRLVMFSAITDMTDVMFVHAFYDSNPVRIANFQQGACIMHFVVSPLVSLVSEEESKTVLTLLQKTIFASSPQAPPQGPPQAPPQGPPQVPPQGQPQVPPQGPLETIATSLLQSLPPKGRIAKTKAKKKSK